MSEETKVTQPVVEPTNEVKTFTQEELNEVVQDRLAKEKNKFAKELGIGDNFDKEGYSKFKEYQETQKTEAQKSKDEAEAWKHKYAEVSEKVKTTQIEMGLTKVLHELKVDDKQSKLISKLVDLTDVYIDELNYEKLKENVDKVIKEYDIQSVSAQVKVGVEKQSTEPKSSGTDYLDDKYKNNPYYKKNKKE